MSLSPLQELSAAYREAAKVNERALELLKTGQGPETLEPLFKAKEGLLRRILEGQAAVVSAPKDETDLKDALAAQAACARLEAQVAQVLGERHWGVKSVSDITEAYRSKLVDKLGTRKLDLES